MTDINPYKPSNVELTKGIAERDERDRCPSCGASISRWQILNATTAGRCGQCHEKLWLVLPISYRLYLVFFGLALTVPLWLVSELLDIQFIYLFLIVPLAVSGLSTWMQMACGKIRSTSTRGV